MFVDCSEPLWTTLDDISRDEGLVLYDVERRGSRSLLVLVERVDGCATHLRQGSGGQAGMSHPPAEETSEKQAGVTSGDLSRLCRRLMVFFTAKGEELGVGSEPDIEVSSPGINRTLRLPGHFERAVGERVKVVVNDVSQGPESDSGAAGTPGHAVVGMLRGVAGESLEILPEDPARKPEKKGKKEERSTEPVTIPIKRIRRANVEFAFGKP